MSAEHEAAFLACVLWNQDILYKTSLTEEHFLYGEHRRIYRAMQKCADDGVKVDYIAVCDRDAEITKGYIVTLGDKIASASNWAHYQGAISDEFQRARLARLGRRLAGITAADKPLDVIEEAENELLMLGTNGQSRKVERIADVLPQTLAKIEERVKLKGALPGIATGLPSLDIMTGGFQDDRYIVIGARPSDGKSALALNMACDIALRQRIPVGIISAESSNNEMVTRALTSEGRIRGSSIMHGLLGSKDIGALADAAGRLKDSPLYLYDAPNVRFGELKSVARQMVGVHKVRVIFVDYVQIVQWEDRRLAMHEQVANVSRGLKQLARELKVPIVGLSQLKRDSEGREPEMSDLDYSKQLEQDADTLIFIYHPRPKGDEEPKPSMLLIKKNRDGPKGAVLVDFFREYVRFEELQR